MDVSIINLNRKDLPILYVLGYGWSQIRRLAANAIHVMNG